MPELIRELTPAEREKPYAKYCFQPMAVPPSQILAELNKGPMDPAQATPLEQLNDLLAPGPRVENGYCLLPNGAGYVAIQTPFPGCTLEMLAWWFAWHPLEPMRYTLWDPKAHHSVAIGDQDRKKILDPRVPLMEKTRGVTHFVVEDIGGGLDDILIHFMSPLDMGFDPARLGQRMAIGGWAEFQSRANGAQRGLAVMAHLFQETSEGVTLRSRFWMGYKHLGGAFRLMLPPGVQLPIQAPMGLAYHCTEEYSNLAAILPNLYREMEGKVDK